MIVYPETHIRCLSCKWTGSAGTLDRNKDKTLDEHTCPDCGTVLVRSDWDDHYLIPASAKVVVNH